MLAVSVTLLVGLISGLLVGWLVGYLKLDSMIVTLGMLSVLQALTLIYTNGQFQTLIDKSTWYAFIGGGYVSIIPFPVILYAMIVVIFWIILNKMVFGKQLQAVGYNRVASQFSGIKDKKVVLSTFVLTGVLSAVAGILISSRVLGSQNTMGQGYEFSVITAVILGGASITGGYGSIYKTTIGALLIGFLNNGFIMVGVPYYYQYLAQWFIIVGVVWADLAAKERAKESGVELR